MNLLFLTGPHAVGKSYLMNNLAKKTSFFTFDTGPHMRKMHQEQAPNISIGEWVDSLENEYGPYITCEMLCQQFEKEYDGSANVIITGFRQIEGILYMIEYLKPENQEIFYLDADITLLKENFEKRENKKLTISEFEKYIKDEEDWGLLKLKQWVFSDPINCQYYKKKTNSDEIEINIFGNKVKKIGENDGK